MHTHRRITYSCKKATRQLLKSSPGGSLCSVNIYWEEQSPDHYTQYAIFWREKKQGKIAGKQGKQQEGQELNKCLIT